MAAPNPFPPFTELTSQDFQKFQQQLGDTSLQDPVGTIFEAAFASQKDFFSDRVRFALKAKLAGIAPTDALTQIGIERGITQNPGETDTAFATRVLNAWLVWPWAGSARGVLRALYDAGYTGTMIVQQLGNQYTLDANQNLVLTTSPRWYFDVQSPSAVPVSWQATTVYGRNAVVVPLPLTGFLFRSWEGGTSGNAQPTWPTQQGLTVNDNGIIWGCCGQDFWSRFSVVFTSMPASWGGNPPAYSSQEVTRIRNLINQWKSAHSTCVKVTVIQVGRLLGYPARNLGGGAGNLGGNTTTDWSPV